MALTQQQLVALRRSWLAHWAARLRWQRALQRHRARAKRHEREGHAFPAGWLTNQKGDTHLDNR